jgi:beta-glucanase (GH16 family)
MLPSDNRYGTWAASGEIDILESRGSAVHETLGTLHFGGKWPDNRHVGSAYAFPETNAAEEFHLYAIEWEANEIRWFLDGELWQTRKKEEWDSEAAPKNPHAPFDQPFHLIINVAVDGGFFANTDQKSDRLPGKAFPQELLVDYVRVYQWAD